MEAGEEARVTAAGGGWVEGSTAGAPPKWASEGAVRWGGVARPPRPPVAFRTESELPGLETWAPDFLSAGLDKGRNGTRLSAHESLRKTSPSPLDTVKPAGWGGVWVRRVRAKSALLQLHRERELIERAKFRLRCCSFTENVS